MKFTIERAALIKMLKHVGKKMPAKKHRDKQVRLYACGARVFVEANESTAGVEALVFRDGMCLVPHDVLSELLKSYAPQANLTFDADERTIKFGSTTLPVSGFSAIVSPPGRFLAVPVTDTWITGALNPPPRRSGQP